MQAFATRNNVYQQGFSRVNLNKSHESRVLQGVEPKKGSRTVWKEAGMHQAAPCRQSRDLNLPRGLESGTADAASLWWRAFSVD